MVQVGFLPGDWHHVVGDFVARARERVVQMLSFMLDLKELKMDGAILTWPESPWW
jgi:hypothetical protein